MRSEFEKWYRDKHQITKPLYFFEDTQRYEDGFTQDAWEVWQHQQSKVDELQKRVDELHTAFKQLIEMENESISFEHDLFDKGWNQSARQTIENIYKLAGLGEQALKGGGDE